MKVSVCGGTAHPKKNGKDENRKKRWRDEKMVVGVGNGQFKSQERGKQTCIHKALLLQGNTEENMHVSLSAK